jgi:ribosomal-protein-alanine N-acetyltransferase
LNTIETDRLILRGWKEDDYLDLHEFVSDDRACQNAGCLVVKDIEESKNIIKTCISYNQSYAIVIDN